MDIWIKILQNLRTEHCPKEKSKRSLEIIKKFSNIFYLPGDQLSCTNNVVHDIDTKDHKPIFNKTYRYPAAHKEEVKRQIDEMQKQKIIRPSNSPWNSPLWVVPKKMDASGKTKWRIVIDFRKLNDITEADKFPLPNIEDILDNLGRAKYFTTLDLTSGFHQVSMNERDIPKTAFSTEDGHWEYTKMPFGLKNAPATFQRLMNSVLPGLTPKQCLVYLDDIIIFGNSLEQHNERLTSVLRTLEKNNLKVQPDKCEFLRTEVKYLGHIISNEGVKPNPDKIETIQNFPIPRTDRKSTRLNSSH